MACPTVGSQHEAGQRVGDIAQIVTRPDNQISPLTRLEQTGVVEAETACAPSGRHFHDVDRHERVRAQLAEPGRVERLAEFREEVERILVWYRVGRKDSRPRRGILRSRAAAAQISRRNCVLSPKVRLHCRRPLNPQRQEGLWNWRKVAEALHEAGVPMQTGTVAVERRCN